MRSHLARSIDPRYPTVRAGLGLAILAGVIGVASELGDGAGFSDAIGFSIGFGTATFLAWAIGRELDPDDPATGTLAAAATIPLSLWVGPALIGPTVAVLLIARIVVRTSGRPMTTTDQVGMIALGAWVAASTTGLVAALGLSFATARDVRLPGSTSRLQLITSLTIAIAATMRRLLADPESTMEWTIPILIITAAGLLSGAMLRLTRPPTSVGDLSPEPLHPVRIQSGRRHVLVTTALATLLVGAAAAVGLIPVLTALAASQVRQRYHNWSSSRSS